MGVLVHAHPDQLKEVSKWQTGNLETSNIREGVVVAASVVVFHEM